MSKENKMADQVQESSAPQTEQPQESQEVQETPQAEATTEQTSEGDAQAQSSDTEKAEEIKAKAEAGEKLTKAEKRFLKELEIKVDGKVEKVELPFDLEDDPKKVDWMRKQLQLSKVSQKRMAESSQLQKEVASFIEELKKNPAKVLSDPTLGVDFKKVVKEFIEEEMAREAKTPEQLEVEKLREELKSIKEKEAKEKEENERKEFERLQAQQEEMYDMKMTKALQDSKLPKTPYIVKKMADYLLLALNNGIDAEPIDVIPLIEEEMRNDIKQMFSASPQEFIEQMIGKDKLNEVRKSNLKKAPPTPVKKIAPDVGAKNQPKVEEKKKVTFKEFFGV